MNKKELVLRKKTISIVICCSFLTSIKDSCKPKAGGQLGNHWGEEAEPQREEVPQSHNGVAVGLYQKGGFFCQ